MQLIVQATKLKITEARNILLGPFQAGKAGINDFDFFLSFIFQLGIVPILSMYTQKITFCNLNFKFIFKHYFLEKKLVIIGFNLLQSRVGTREHYTTSVKVNIVPSLFEAFLSGVRFGPCVITQIYFSKTNFATKI